MGSGAKSTSSGTSMSAPGWGRSSNGNGMDIEPFSIVRPGKACGRN
jgi:hypothetical protein